MIHKRQKETRGERLEIRLTPRQSDMLRHMSMEMDKSKSEIVRDAIEMQYKMLKYRQ